MSKHLETGRWGEDQAAAWLVAQGFVVVARNFRHRKAEIDLIAQQGNLLVFVEVKTRTRVDFGPPELAVTKRKAQLIITAAEAYLFAHNWQGEIRFDILAIVKQGNAVDIAHFEDAFY